MKIVKVFFLASLMGFFIPTFAQVAINESGTTPNGAAMLDVSSTSKGMLIPRMTKAERDVIGSPVAGLMIYQTDNTPGFYFHDGSAWKLIGSEALSINDLSDGKSSVSSVFLGSGSGNVDNGGSNYNTAIGILSLYKVINGIQNTAIGFKSLYNNIGQINTSVGYLSMESNTSGSENTAIGAFALNKNTSGSKNTALGFESLYSNNNVIAINNLALGYKSLRSNTTGKNNTACGESALFTNSSGDYNTAIGSTALFFNTTGNQNFAAGLGAATRNNSGNNNIAIGYNANYYNQTGSNNTIIGTEAGNGSSNHNKSGNVFLGYQAGFSETASNKLYIENSNAASPLIYGEFDNDYIKINGDFETTGKATINDVLHLTPLASAPTTANNGDIYVGTDNHIYCYLGSEWKQLDN